MRDNQSISLGIVRFLMHLLICIAGWFVIQAFEKDVVWSSRWGSIGLAVLVVHVVARVFQWNRFRPAGFLWSPQQLSLPQSQTNWRSNHLINAWIEVPNLIRTAAFIGLIVSLYRPQFASQWENSSWEGIDVILALDISESMLSMDFEPNRLESSKKVALDFIESRPNDRFGVVAFEGEAFTKVPISTDHATVQEGIRQLVSGSDAIDGGTAIGTGLAVSVNRLKDSEANSKVIILLTDGENNAGQIEPIDAAQMAKQKGIRIYTIGVGSRSPAKTPVAKRPDGTYEYARRLVNIDEKSLQKVAEEADGLYFRATDANDLAAIYAEIDQLEKTTFNVSKYQKRSEASGPWILFAIVALALEFVLKSSLFRTVAE